MSTEIKPVDDIRKSFMSMEAQFKMVLPEQVPVERFIRVILTAVQNNPQLLQVNRQSLFSAAMKAATDGLLADGREGAIIPFKGNAQWLPMIAGILKKVRNSGELSTITSQVVYEHDEFDYFLDFEGEHLKHRPKLDGDRGKPRLTYAIAKTKDGGVYTEVMTEEQMNAVRNMSRAKDSGPWSGPFEDEMRRKTALRRLSKRLPMSTDLEDVIRRDDDLYDLPAVTAGSSHLALAEHQAARDFLPGIKPPQTAKEFCEKLKDVPGGAQLIWRQIEMYRDGGDTEWVDKLTHHAVLAKISGSPSPESFNDKKESPVEKFPFEQEVQR